MPLRASRTDLRGAMNVISRGATLDRNTRRLLGSFVVIELAIAAALLTASVTATQYFRKLVEEHTIVESDDPHVKIGDRFEVLSAHCCATMNLHRTCVAVRRGVVEAVWPIEASGRYD